MRMTRRSGCLDESLREKGLVKGRQAGTHLAYAADQAPMAFMSRSFRIEFAAGLKEEHVLTTVSNCHGNLSGRR